MNKRIKELAEQATTKISFRLDPNTYKHIDDPDGDLERFEFDKQKFAELIVRECARVAFESDLTMAIGQWGADSAILKHFGVEE